MAATGTALGQADLAFAVKIMEDLNLGRSTELKLPLMLYDSECTLCSRFKEALMRLPGSHKLSVASAHDDKIYQQFPELSKTECLATLHVLDESGKIHRAGEAVQYLIQLLPGTSKFAWLIESDMGQKTSEFFYKMANHYRESLLNRCTKCKND